MRTPARFAFAVVALLACASAAGAKGRAPAKAAAASPPQWVSVSPEGEGFVVKMPRAPESSDVNATSKGVSVVGRRYESAGEDSNTYAVWSLTFRNVKGGSLASEIWDTPGVPAGQDFLDVVAEFAWDAIVKPESDEAARRQERPAPSADLARFFKIGARPAREYRMRLRGRGGPAYVYSDGRRAYVVTAFGPEPQSPALKKFVESFAVVTKKAVLTVKPEPDFTESARKFNVAGTVRLRAVLTASGRVGRIYVVGWLPHGLTLKACRAASLIKFEPAQKDGRAVSQYVALEYNFNTD